MQVAYRTTNGFMLEGQAEDVFGSDLVADYAGEVDLIFTSPPFPLNRKKKYGNLRGDEYRKWLAAFAPVFKHYLKPTGSIVLEVGNSWEPGRPVMSTLALRALLSFLDEGEFVLCQQFVYYNPARLPSPAQWVNVERIRVKDSYTHLWWMAMTDKPMADNRHILQPYSESMEKLLRRQTYNSGRRPSQHNIGKRSFLRANAGAIPSNVIRAKEDEPVPENIIALANTHSTTAYLEHCRSAGLTPHPARMPEGLPEFFIKFLTPAGGLVLDPFAGSNTTGASAERLGRRWIAIEPNRQYIDGSAGRFRETRSPSKPRTSRRARAGSRDCR